MVTSIYSNKKGIYQDLYREIDAKNKKKETSQIKRQPRGIYKDLYRTIESEKRERAEGGGVFFGRNEVSEKEIRRPVNSERPRQISFKANEINENKDDKKSIWHTYPLKICAYSNDVGEAVRPVIGAFFAKLSWLPAIFYIRGAILSKAFCPNSPDKSKEVSKEILFQGIASLLLPMILVKSVVKAKHKILDALPTKSKEFIKNGIKKFDWLNKLNENRYRATCESAVGLLALAVAVKPIDYYTEKALNKVYSKT